MIETTVKRGIYVVSKQFLAIIAVIILGLFGVFTLTKDKDQSSSAGGSSQTQASEHKVGAGNKGVVILEYGDFQCPACKSFYPLVQQIKQEYGDDITVQFRHFPLTQIHPNAMISSRAAEAAGKQGKFFEMHDLLYENQDSWGPESNPTVTFEGYATQLGLNIEQFKADMSSADVASTINADLKAGQQAGVSSTPTFLINGRKLDKNPASLDEFKQLIDEEIAKQPQ